MDWLYANKAISQKLDEDQLFDMSYVTYANAVVKNMTHGGLERVMQQNK
jgi:hypothetical protein